MNTNKYNPAFCEDMLKFFEGPAFHVTEVQKKDGSISLVETAAELPTFAAFAKKIGVTCRELRVWEKTYPAFEYACEQARERQGNILLQNALRGHYASSFAVFTAKNLLGWKENKETDAAPSAVEITWEEK